MECASFKRHQPAPAAAGAFRKHPDRNVAFFKLFGDLCNGAVRFGPVITVNQQVTGQPIQWTKERYPQQALFTHGHGTRLHRFGGGHHIVVILVVSDINAVAIFGRIGRYADFHLQTE
ncbi:hypothetical protein D3C72_1875670 [compost metagenome]